MSKQYTKGRRTEYRCKEALKGLGVGLIARSAGSRGLADLIAVFPVKREIWLVQVKSGHPPSRASLGREYGALKEMEGSYTVKTKAYVRRGKGKTYGFEEILAEAE